MDINEIRDKVKPMPAVIQVCMVPGKDSDLWNHIQDECVDLYDTDSVICKRLMRRTMQATDEPGQDGTGEWTPHVL